VAEADLTHSAAPCCVAASTRHVGLHLVVGVIDAGLEVLTVDVRREPRQVARWIACACCDWIAAMSLLVLQQAVDHAGIEFAAVLRLDLAAILTSASMRSFSRSR
jgi:hypothetical protein